MKKYHLVILKKPYLEAILAGRKKLESRFSSAKRPPFGQVKVGDKLFLKKSSGPVCATATVAQVKNFENLCRHKILRLKHQYNDLICGSEEYWQSKAHCAFGILLWLEDIREIEPVRIAKSDWRAWVVLKEGKDFGLLRESAR
ncbi:ASCH domain-containing protein [Planctomycetota bacterium]